MFFFFRGSLSLSLWMAHFSVQPGRALRLTSVTACSEPILPCLIPSFFFFFFDTALYFSGRWLSCMKEEVLEMMPENQLKIQAFAFVSSVAHIREQNRHLKEWLWKLRDDADDVLDELEYRKQKILLA
ncbi:hypothetical protein KFK09_010244 [Dendrobium nobile]|uniref:Rx N-terminal domain-containing protein n=1 Tax=Dendrobium nobile TaxID=94219 RepID=A0A8T3BNC2_DENNO|nr:hypothetical protein KFK09_010244 [Dendrobium nobile]